MRWNVLVAIRRARLTLPLLVALSITILWPSPAKAGTTLTGPCPIMIVQSGDYSLGTDIGPCSLDGIDILVSGVTLHLNGHAITGTCTSGIGIHVGVPLSPTTLTQVRVLGSGTISSFTSGFVADNSAGSFVKFVTFTPNCPKPAFSVGFDIRAPSSQWKLEGNVALEPANNRNNSAGIVLRSGTNDSDVVRNNVNDTISVDGNDNTIVNNIANDNVGGIFVTGNTNEIHANTTDNNSGAPGIWLTCSTVSGNCASGNHISGNTSLGNTPYDLEDDFPSCDSNKWEGNKFQTANQSCIH